MADPVILEAHGTAKLVLTDTCIPGDFLGFDGTNWIRADADATAPIRGEFIAIEKGNASGDTITVAKRAIVYDSDAPYTKGAWQYLSGTAGKHTETNPGAALDMTQVVGRALTTDTVVLDTDVPHIVITKSLDGTAPATGANYGHVFIADRTYRIVGARESHRTAGSDAGAVTLTVEKAASGVAEGSGVNMLSTTFNLKSTADTPVWLGPSTTAADTRLIPGDHINLVDAGTLTAVAGLVITIVLVPDL